MAIVVLASARPASAEPVVMRLHHTAPLDHQITLALHAFANDVRERTHGEVVVDVVTKPRETVPPPQFAKAVKDGVIEAACMPTFLWAREVPELDFSLIPYYFTTLDDMRRFPASDAAGFVEQRLNGLGVKTLSWLHVTRVSLLTSSDRPILAPSDLKGRRVRAMNEFGKTPFTAVGAVPVLVDAGNLVKTIKAGELDVVLTDLSSAVGIGLYDVHKYGTLAPFFSAYYHLFVSPTWLAGLAPAHRQAIEAAAATLTSTAVTITEARAAASLDILKARGVTVHTQTADEQRAWVAAMQTPAFDAFVNAAPGRAQFLARLPK